MNHLSDEDREFVKYFREYSEFTKEMDDTGIIKCRYCGSSDKFFKIEDVIHRFTSIGAKLEHDLPDEETFKHFYCSCKPDRYTLVRLSAFQKAQRLGHFVAPELL